MAALPPFLKSSLRAKAWLPLKEQSSHSKNPTNPPTQGSPWLGLPRFSTSQPLTLWPRSSSGVGIGGCPVRCTIFSCFPASTHQTPTALPPPVVMTENITGNCPMCPEGQNWAETADLTFPSESKPPHSPVREGDLCVFPSYR